MREIAQYAYFQQGARAAGLDDLALTATRSYDPPESYSNGTVVVIVEVDVGTGEVTIERPHVPPAKSKRFAAIEFEQLATLDQPGLASAAVATWQP